MGEGDSVGWCCFVVCLAVSLPLWIADQVRNDVTMLRHRFHPMIPMPDTGSEGEQDNADQHLSHDQPTMAVRVTACTCPRQFNHPYLTNHPINAYPFHVKSPMKRGDAVPTTKIELNSNQ